MRRVAAGLVALLFLGSCSARGTDRDVVHVYAASSLTEVFPEIDDAPSYQFAGSDELALQIREGAGADVFAAASPKYPDELAHEGIVEDPVEFATNELVLIVPRANEAGIHGIDDLRAPGVKLVIGAKGVPVGDYTRAALENLHASDVLDQVVSEEQDVKAVVGKVLLGEADAGFVYATDVSSADGDVVAIRLPRAARPTVEYTIAVVADTARRAAAEAFVDSVLGPEGRNALSDAGFGLP